MYSRHGSDKAFFYRVSRNSSPLTIDDWSEEKSVERGAPTTYANLVRLKSQEGSILNFHRCINWNPTLSIYDEYSDQWSEPLPFIKAGTGKVRPYFKLTSDGISRTHFIYTDHHPNNFNNFVYHLYFENGKFFNSQGVLLKEFRDGPLDHDAGQRGSFVYEFKDECDDGVCDIHECIPGGRAWVWDITLNQDGQPVCVFSVCKRNNKEDGWLGDRIYYYYWAILTNDGWTKRCIASAGRPLYDKERDYAAGICLDKNNPYKVYLCSNSTTPLLTDLNIINDGINDKYALYEVSLNNQLDVSIISIFHQGNAFRPYSISSEDDKRALFWLTGSYISYREYQTDLNIKKLD